MSALFLTVTDDVAEVGDDAIESRRTVDDDHVLPVGIAGQLRQDKHVPPDPDGHGDQQDPRHLQTLRLLYRPRRVGRVPVGDEHGNARHGPPVGREASDAHVVQSGRGVRTSSLEGEVLHGPDDLLPRLQVPEGHGRLDDVAVGDETDVDATGFDGQS